MSKTILVFMFIEVLCMLVAAVFAFKDNPMELSDFVVLAIYFRLLWTFNYNEVDTA